MINIVFKKRKNTFFFFEVRGHANMSSYGNDIVCASISSTSLMTLNAILEVLKLKPIYDVKEGYLLCDLESEKADTYADFIKAFYLFSKEVETQYPKNIKLKVMEV